MYSKQMMSLFTNKYRRCTAHRLTAIAALVSFTIGNVGWPQAFDKPGAKVGGCRLVKLGAKAGCCCGPQKQKSSCGCCRRAVAVKVASCCQKIRPAAEKLSGPALTCDCADSSFPGFIVSSQPKLGTASPQLTQLSRAFAESPAYSIAVPERTLAPETPPPRPAVG